MITEIEEMDEALSKELDDLKIYILQQLQSVVDDIFRDEVDPEEVKKAIENRILEVKNTLELHVSALTNQEATELEDAVNNEPEHDDDTIKLAIDLLQEADKVLKKLVLVSNKQELKNLRFKIDEFYRDNDINRSQT